MRRLFTLLKHGLFAGLSGMLLIGFAFPAAAQRSCGTPLAIKQALQRNPKLLKKYQRLQRSSPMNLADRPYMRGAPVAVIPVVVHIVLQDPESVTDAQVRSQIKVLNADYELLNADTSNIPDIWKTTAGDMKIAFCLAARTPDGAPSNGIDRVKTSKRVFDVDYAASGVKHASSGGADAWNTDDYLNIWVCNLSGDNLGVGTPPDLYPKEEQGVVIQYTAFGTTGNLLPGFDKGRSCTHEIGHFFNLLHPWGNQEGNCSPGDYVEDTPPQSAAVYGNQAFPYLQDPCSPDYPGIMIDNFMGYTDDAVMNMFTLGQVARAKTALFGPRSSLLSSKGCQPVLLEDEDARLRSVSAPVGKLCSGQVAPLITLENFGKHLLQEVTLKYRIDGGAIQTYHWKGHLESLDSVKVTLPAATVLTGMHQFRVFASLPNGQADEQTGNDTLTTTFHLDPVETAPYEEGFESGSFPPAGWTLSNPDHQYTWEKTNEAAHAGAYSAVIKNLDYEANGPVDELTSPVFNPGKADSAFLFFNVAAAVQSDPGGNNAYWDTLQVLISYDCGQSGHSLYKKWGANLITDSLPVQKEFVPNSRQWRRDSIDLTPYLNQGPFRIIFRNITNYENNIYLDDIRLITRPVNPILKERKMIVVPNPTSGSLYIQFLKPPSLLRFISIYNAAGQLVARKAASALTSSNRIIFNLANEPDGVYFVKIYYTDHEITKKIIKIK